MHGPIRTPLWFFFFQAEAGIRDLTVTGVQTCALPIWLHSDPPAEGGRLADRASGIRPQPEDGLPRRHGGGAATRGAAWHAVETPGVVCRKIGRASCRERV